MEKKFTLAVAALLALTTASAAQAATLTIYSGAATFAAQTDDGSRLASGDTSGLTFTPAALGDFGTFTPVPGGAPSGTRVVNVADLGWWNGASGLFEMSFTLPANVTAITLSGAANVDDSGSVFINGHNIGSATEFGNTPFLTTNLAYFNEGVNTLVVSDSNTDGPSGAAFYANVDYVSTVPLPAALPMFGAAMAGLAGLGMKKGRKSV